MVARQWYCSELQCSRVVLYTAWCHIMAHASNWHKIEVKIFNNNDSLSRTRVVTKINGHEDKRSSKFSNLNSVNSKIAETKQQNRLKQCFL